MKTPAFPRTALIAVAAASLPLAACVGGDEGPGYASDRGDYVLTSNDTVYRDNDGRYYCQKPDGTKGLIIGGLAGGVLGNIIAPNGSKTLGTIIGAAGGAIAGRAIERGEVRCR
ncbi:outer membrane lipoprotein SlyB [Sphingobium xanthum]|uniref:glycine zipper 2TM domain-containing protein n=1 Tax=Sphingobium xanthum TaxID=1387165 RepID=UPI001C8C55C1|nr:glycine zipper 2TM domain-containing protein [Sphingobium xanthum]